MTIKRINKENLNKIINGKTTIPGTCIVKFYSNECHLCHNLKEYYEHLAQDYTDKDGLYFYAFNVADDPGIDSRLGFEGVPTIIAIKVAETSKTPLIREAPIPDTPNEHTWYHVNEVRQFIDKEIV